MGQWTPSWSLPLGTNVEALPNYFAIQNRSDQTLRAGLLNFISQRVSGPAGSGPLGPPPSDDPAWASDAGSSADNPDCPPVLLGVLEAVAAAQTVIVERGYFDLDCRSEEAVAIMRQHRFTLVSHDRLHFFSKLLTKRVFLQAIADTNLQRKLQDAYLGYVVLRNAEPSTAVGRTMLATPRTDERLLDPGTLVTRVRTRVREHITLAGIPLHVDAVPFIQQDGGLTRCAHAATWMVHYSAVLRGYITRRPVADMHPTVSDGHTSRRPLPSPGLTTDQLMDALWAVGFTPEVWLINRLTVPDQASWRHRRELVASGQPNTWHLEAFTTSVCRYLNSGLPVLLAVGDHVRVICGYLRNRELVRGRARMLSQDPSRVENFILNDDGKGPYQIEHVEDLVGNDDQDMLIFPTPPGLILGGQEAEVIGAAFVQELLFTLLSGDKISAHQRQSLGWLEASLSESELALRTYMAEGNLFKRSFALRCSEDILASRLVPACRLPRYVWVCEIIDRRLRHADGALADKSVVGQIVIDGSAVHASRAEVLVSHLPGWLGLRDQLHKVDADYPCEALVCSSGRWGHQQDNLDDGNVAIVSKTAGGIA